MEIKIKNPFACTRKVTVGILCTLLVSLFLALSCDKPKFLHDDGENPIIPDDCI
jgi:hypothetical protein